MADPKPSTAADAVKITKDTAAGAEAKAATRPLTLRGLVMGPILAGVLIVVVFLGGFGAWASLAPLSSAAIATGIVSPDGNRRTVQHLEGGIVREILVTEGDQVAVGDPVVILEDVASRAERNMRESRLHVYRTLEARLVTELEGAETLELPDDLLVLAETDIVVRTAIEDQHRQFEVRRETLVNRRDILGARIGQLREEIGGHQAQITALERQLELIDREIADVESLVARGLERMPRLLSLQREQAEIAGDIGANQAAIAQAEQSIGETELQIMDLETNRREENAEALAGVRAEITTIFEELSRHEDALQRTVIRAPVPGTVVNLRIFTEGGVIGPGNPILDIVPEDEELIIEARVSPTDIDVVSAGLPAEIYLTAFTQRHLPRLIGEVRTVSADSLTDQNTGEPYYRAVVEVPGEELAALDEDIVLTPGMPVEVMIATGAHTVLTYLMAPVERSLNRTFREE